MHVSGKEWHRVKSFLKILVSHTLLSFTDSNYTSSYVLTLFHSSWILNSLLFLFPFLPVFLLLCLQFISHLSACLNIFSTFKYIFSPYMFLLNFIFPTSLHACRFLIGCRCCYFTLLILII